LKINYVKQGKINTSNTVFVFLLCLFVSSSDQLPHNLSELKWSIK